MGPASKRIKTDTDDNQSLVQIQQTVPQQQNQPLVQSPPVVPETKPQLTVEQQIMHFKMEPEETAVSLTNEEDANYDDSAMDDMGMDNSTDYLMESTSDMDNSKAGTSTAMESIDAGGDNQGTSIFFLILFTQGIVFDIVKKFSSFMYLTSFGLVKCGLVSACNKYKHSAIIYFENFMFCVIRNIAANFNFGLLLM